MPGAQASAKPVVTNFRADLDPHVAAMDRQTAAMNDLVEQIKNARQDFKPAADAVHRLGAAQEKFCNFLVNNRLKLLSGSIAALVAVGAISPNLANGIGIFLKAVGLQ